ncbi:hypothetical protein F4821DRAFT_99266 [Hypoxylon rubiginosum]|uniref:Uncharacterized protein n=1 Tax=Hypoxylon rubiginosum TaxID=110542 RepID=A0ACC0D525_9PEZI|nr:hypothetical protein F4821DRAFT_99266 [Hypoxylon rubiginosum]
MSFITVLFISLGIFYLAIFTIFALAMPYYFIRQWLASLGFCNPLPGKSFWDWWMFGGDENEETSYRKLHDFPYDGNTRTSTYNLVSTHDDSLLAHDTPPAYGSLPAHQRHNPPTHNQLLNDNFMLWEAIESLRATIFRMQETIDDLRPRDEQVFVERMA